MNFSSLASSLNIADKSTLSFSCAGGAYFTIKSWTLLLFLSVNIFLFISNAHLLFSLDSCGMPSFVGILVSENLIGTKIGQCLTHLVLGTLQNWCQKSGMYMKSLASHVKELEELKELKELKELRN